MRKVIFSVTNSLDNYIARKDGSFDWLLHSDESIEVMKEMWPRFDAIVMGRRTYDVATANMSEADREKMKDLHAGITTYVFSRTLSAPAAIDAVVVNSDPGEFVRDLKQQGGKDIMVMGGGELARSLFEAGVIDEMTFNIQPILLGSGIPLFHEMPRQIDLELIQSRPMKNGCVYVKYRVKK